jgi:WD40 repeat protein
MNNDNFCTQGSARIWEAGTGKGVARMTHNSCVVSVAFSPDGRYIVSGSYDATARVWDAGTGKETARMIHDGDIYSVAFSLDGEYVVSGSADNTARVWEATTGKEIARMMHDDDVSSVAFSLGGKYVVSGSYDGTARVWIWRSEDLVAEACLHVTRNLTRDEWQQYIGDALPYQAVCPNLPIEPEPTFTSTP